MKKILLIDLSINKLLLQIAYFGQKFAIIFKLIHRINLKILSNFWLKIFNFRNKSYLGTNLILLIVMGFAICAPTYAANQGDVVINEIAWMGSINSANDEWMELFNTTASPIDLSGWILKSADQKLKINLKGIIPAQRFYLLERTDDNSVPNIPADLVYKGDLNNTGEDLTLYDNSNNIIDQINYPIKWPAGNNTTKQTMEKTADLQWQTSKDQSGTPKAQNSTGIQKIVSAIITYPGGIVINEILPNPDAPAELNEWIELYNSNSFDVDLSGWKIQNTLGTKRTYIIPKNTLLLANNYLILKRPDTKIALKDGGDTLHLLQPNGMSVDSVTYANAPKNESYNKIHSNWKWSSTLTPGAINVTPTALPKTQKTDNNTINKNLLADISNSKNSVFNFANPWFLFFTVVAIIII